MYQVRVEAVAIVNDEISVADLCGLNRDHLNGLKKPVIMFLKSTKGALIKPLTCHQKITLRFLQLLCRFCNDATSSGKSNSTTEKILGLN
ncbi:15086_t:CDS:2 [Entrophospora sp. SA101]|nr:15086_t:CDS:2 [Entrophospora sp. SA101]